MKFKISIPKFPEKKSLNYLNDFRSYSDYNYISGKLKIFKRSHYYKALELSQSFLKKNLVAIDYGCSDGFFSFTLSKYYKKVIGIDNDKKSLEFAEEIKKINGIENIEFITIKDLIPNNIKKKITSLKISIIYCLEVIEHIYDKRNPYQVKINKIKELLDILSDDGRLIVSIPNMIGFSLFLKFLISRIYGGVNREKISLINLLKAVFLKDTNNLLKDIIDLYPGDWGVHTGFNHKYLEYYLKKEGIKIEKIRYIPFKLKIGLNFGVIYIIRKK